MPHVRFVSVPRVRVEVSYMFRFHSSYGRETDWTSRAGRNVMSRRKNLLSPGCNIFVCFLNTCLISVMREVIM